MDSIARISELAQRFLIERPKELERPSGFVKRRTARLDGPKFVQMCVLGWMNNASASYSQLNHVVASLGLHVRNQALEERFGPASSQLMRQVLEEATGQLLQGQAVETPLFEHFAGGVFLQDGTVVSLPNALSTRWRGSGGPSGSNESGVRIQARWEMRCGGLHGLWMQDARSSERQGPALEEPYPQDSLRIVDTAYLSYADMRAASQSRRFWITGVKADMLFADQQGRLWNLTEWLRSLPADEQVVEGWVRAGKRDQVPVRLIALRLPQEAVRRRQQRAKREVERRPREPWCPTVWTTVQAWAGPPSTQASQEAPQGECEQTAPAGVAASADQRRWPCALGSTSRGAHALARAYRAVLETLETGRPD
jgi:hypothetical protein